MAVDWVQTWNWGPLHNPGDWQTNYYRIPFSGAPHVLTSAYVNTLSLGTKDGVAGEVLVGFKRFEYLDGNGVLQEAEITTVSSWLEVPKCVSITLAFDLRAAFAEAGWTLYFLS